MPAQLHMPQVDPDPLVARAIQALNLDVPVMAYTIDNGKVHLFCYGGQILTWPADPTPNQPKPKKGKKP